MAPAGHATREYDALLGILEEGVVLHAMDGSIASCNASVARILGLPAHVLTGCPALFVGLEPRGEGGDPLSPDEEPARLALRTRLPQGPRTLRFRRPDGQPGLAAVRATPLFAPGEPVPAGALTVLEDLTVREASSRRSLEAGRNEAIGRLAEGVVRDLGDLLTAILEHGDALLETLGAGDPRRGDAEEVRKAAARGTELTRRFQEIRAPEPLGPRAPDVRLSALAEPAERRREQAADSPAAAAETLLLVEDDEQVRRLAKRILEGHGFDVLEASDGREGLALLERHAPRIHALITDVVMPELSGPELARRATARVPGLPVLFLSGFADLEQAAGGVTVERACFLAKPFEPGALVGKLREMMAQPRVS